MRTDRRLHAIAFGTFVIAILFAATPAHATAITVANSSFETLPGGGLPFTCGTACSFSTGAIPGWTNSGITGQFQPGEPTNMTYFSTRATDSTATLAYSDGGTISQTVGATVQTGVVYTFMVDIGERNDVGFAGVADLLINGVEYAATGIAPSRGSWSTFTATYTGTAADAGKSITIELKSAGVEGDFDNVRLSDNTVAATPEPGTILLLGSGLVGLAGFARRRFVR